MITIASSPEWKATHPGAAIGLLEMSRIDNGQPSARLEARKREIEIELRERYAGFTRQDFLALPVMTVYDRYYARFDKTYHVQLQLESITLRGKNLPHVSPLVDACFMAEVETLVLTASHDVARLSPPVWIDRSYPGEKMTQMNGTDKEIRGGDMIMRDSQGICCSILYGQDQRSPVTPQTAQVMYVAYCPAGIPLALIETHLTTICAYIRLFAPEAVFEQQQILHAA